MSPDTTAETARLQTIIARLRSAYPDAAIALTYHTTWELLVAVILSAQCTDETVNKVTAQLFRKYRSLGDYIAADAREFEQDIRSTGFYRNKAKNILATARLVQDRYGGTVPDTMDTLVSLPGVARKTANIILGNAFGKVEGIAVDTHVHRISQRLRLVPLSGIGGKRRMEIERNGMPVTDYIKDADPNKIEQELIQRLPHDEWFRFTYRVIDHGRAVCKAQRPQCGNCPLADVCPVSR